MSSNPQKRVRIMIGLVCLGLVSSMSISWTLWAGQRSFPTFPVFETIPQFGEQLSQLLMISFFGLLLILAMNPKRLITSIALGFMLLLALQDQMRWQPWFYQYFLMLLPIAFARRNDPVSNEAILSIYRIVIVSIYLWSGIHKCHSGFLAVHEDLVEPITRSLSSPYLISAINGFGYAIPAIEILMAIGLLFAKTRRLSIYVVLTTHFSILLLLGPLKGEISNPVVWPWNFIMAGMTLSLFWKTDSIRFPNFRGTHLAGPAILVSLLTVLAPASFYADTWDRYLSFNLYGGWQKRMLVKVSQEDLAKLPADWLPYCRESKSLDRHNLLSPSLWSSDELKVPFVSEWRIIRSFTQKLCDLGIGGDQAFIYVEHRHLPDKPKRFFTCQQVEEMRE